MRGKGHRLKSVRVSREKKTNKKKEKKEEERQ